MKIQKIEPRTTNKEKIIENKEVQDAQYATKNIEETIKNIPTNKEVDKKIIQEVTQNKKAPGNKTITVITIALIIALISACYILYETNKGADNSDYRTIDCSSTQYHETLHTYQAAEAFRNMYQATCIPKTKNNNTQ